MRITFTILLSLLSGLSWAGERVQIGPHPSWVNPLPVPSRNDAPAQGGVHYLLIDAQINTREQAGYEALAVELLSAEGVQAFSDVVVGFDPAYQTLTFHYVNLIRQGQVIDKLPVGEIPTYQRETNMERALYDGSLSAVIHLTDVRQGDVLTYAYSISGFHPLLEGQYAGTYYQRTTVPVGRIHTRVLADRPAQTKAYAGAQPATVRKQANGLTEYVWDVSDTPPLLYDTNVPSWYDPHPRVSISTFPDWASVAAWALPLYRSEPLPEGLRQEATKRAGTEEQKIMGLIRFVQDEIRYLGFEGGSGGLQPNPPRKVLDRRYGDCKDKSLLLVTLLRQQGLTAYPVLVNSTVGNTLPEALPSVGVFDHCVVYFHFQGADYYVDPTFTNQRGGLAQMSFPDYGYGLVVRPGEKSLTRLPARDHGRVQVQELITMDSLGSATTVYIRSTYEGARADAVRAEFSTQRAEVLQQNYLNFYANLYPDIESTAPPRLIDHDWSDKNQVVVEEHYRVPRLWQPVEGDSANVYCEFYPLVLNEYLNWPSTSARQMPYYLGPPQTFEQTTTVTFGEGFNVAPEQTRVAGAGFSFQRSVVSSARALTLRYRYERTRSHLPADSVSAFLAAHERFGDQLSYVLTQPAIPSAFSFSWLSLLLALLTAGGTAYGCALIFLRYRPAPWVYAEDKPLSGWVLLPAVGLGLFLVRTGYNMATSELFDHRVWTNGLALVDGSAGLLLALHTLDIVFAAALVVFAAFLLYCYLQRYTCTPRLVMAFYAINFGWTAFIGVLVPLLTDTPPQFRGLLGSLLAALIWIPYFGYAERVKSTFCRLPRQRSRLAQPAVAAEG